MNSYLSIFKEVTTTLASIGLSDEDISSNYATIFTKLKPNAFTFQQLMVDYLCEFNVKSLDFNMLNPMTNGIRVRRDGDALVVTSVTDDTRFVVGDRITHLSGDSIVHLAERYKKLLFYETTERQDWHPILKKQSNVDLKRGNELYHFELNVYELGANEVLVYDDYTEVIVKDMRHLSLNYNTPVLLDLRNATGFVSEKAINHLAEQLILTPYVALVNELTKGSAERLASKLKHVLGRETYGQAGLLERELIDQYEFIYSRTQDETVTPMNHIPFNSWSDTIRLEGKKLLESNY